jgi:hypothetical protein
MTTSSITKKLASAISANKTEGRFHATGTIRSLESPLTIAGIGPLELPIPNATIRKLRNLATPAPYGKGTETLVDKKVRDTLEVPAESIELTETFRTALDGAVDHVAKQLGLERDRLSCELYKLLVYGSGGFFLPHRDSEKCPGMVATLIVVLPCRFSGGELILQQDGVRRTISFPMASSQQGIEYVAFFADCQHEVKKLRSGTRVCLAFNLVLQKSSTRKKTPAHGPADPALTRAVWEWTRERPEKPLVFALEHQYTQGGLEPSLLKGPDREVFDQLLAIAESCECRLHLGQVSRHLCNSAEDGYYDYRSRVRYSDDGEVDLNSLDIGEVYEDEIIVDGWKDGRGKRVAMGPLSCDSSSLISSIPVDEWKPTRQDYEGYTGNAGNTLDRWYHKSALVLWPNRMHFDMLASMGLSPAVVRLQRMQAKLPKTPEDLLEQACDDCQSLAEAIIRKWPDRLRYRRSETPPLEEWHASWLDALVQFDDPDLIGQFLRVLARRDWSLKLDSFIRVACARMGGDEILPHLLEFLQVELPRNDYGRLEAEGLAQRDANWLLGLCEARSKIELPDKGLRELLKAALTRFETAPELSERGRHYPESGLEKTWLALLKAALLLDEAKTTERLFKILATRPAWLDLRSFQVDAALGLRTWAAARWKVTPPQIEAWIEQVRRDLEAATAIRPTPPTDLAREANLDCNCETCRELKAFLIDPATEVARLGTNDFKRSHLDQQIRTKELDVNQKLERGPRSYVLKLTKTIASYERANKQYDSDLKLLARLK